MNTKLTLRPDGELIRAAKEHSAKSGRSVSKLVADFFALIEAQDPPLPTENHSTRPLPDWRPEGRARGRGARCDPARVRGLGTSMLRSLLLLCAAMALLVGAGVAFSQDKDPLEEGKPVAEHGKYDWLEGKWQIALKLRDADGNEAGVQRQEEDARALAKALRDEKHIAVHPRSIERALERKKKR